MPHLRIPVSEKDHIQGTVEAPVTLVEYGDYQCPYCALAYPIVRQIQKQLSSQLCYVFRHFPLQQAHPLSLLAAQAAEAASLQNRFWDMHDMLYRHQKSLAPHAFIEFAEELHLDIPLFKENLENPTLTNIIESDFHNGVRSGVNGTPCFFINEERFDGDRSYDNFLATLVAKTTDSKQ